MPVVLASASPRRQHLLLQLGIEFAVHPSRADETHPPQTNPQRVPEILARRKAEAVARQFPTYLVIAADTVVLLDGQIVEKPADSEHAERMLGTLSGKMHTVVSGVCLAYGGRTHSFSEHTEVQFAPLSAADIAYYVSHQPPLDKAGAYGIQDWIGLVGVARIEGCFYNVMGLPTSRLVAELRSFLAADKP